MTSGDENKPRSSLWGNSDFLKLWSGQTVSDFGSLITGVALRFAAVISLRATPFQMSALAVSEMAPGIVATPFAGVFVDRFKRRPILIGADLGRALALGLIPLAAVFGWLRMDLLYGVSIASSALSSLFQICYRSYLPLIVEKRELVDANSKLTASSAAAEVGAFGIAGWLVQWLSAPFAILIDAISFLISALSLALIGKRETVPLKRTSRKGAWSESREGIGVIRASPVLSALLIAAAVMAFSSSLFGTQFMLFVVRDLKFKPGVLGMIFAVGGLSSVTGALTARACADRFGTGRAMVAGVMLYAAGLMLTPLAPGPTAAGAAMLIGQQLVADGSWTVYEINQVSLRQAITESELLGRVNATIRFTHLISALAGSLVAGIIGETLGLRTTLAMGSVGSAVAAIFLALSPAGSIEKIPESAGVSGAAS